MKELTKKLKEEGLLKTESIIEAFEKIDRLDFVIDYLKDSAYINRPLAIGFGQTISQPLTVAFMLELLQAKEGDKVLDIGFGSGWQLSLIAEIIGESGKIFGIEIVPELFEFGKNNIDKFGFLKNGIAELKLGDGSLGWEEKSLFDKIIVAAAPQEGIPEEWKNQLKVGGRMVLPMNDSLWLIEKISEKEFSEKEYPGFAFVPLIRND